MCQEKLLKWTGLSILIPKTLETDVLVNIAPMYAVKTKTVMSTLFIRRIHQPWIPKQGLSMNFSMLILAIYVVYIKPNLLDFHNVLLYLLKCSFHLATIISVLSSMTN